MNGWMPVGLHRAFGDYAAPTSATLGSFTRYDHDTHLLLNRQLKPMEKVEHLGICQHAFDCIANFAHYCPCGPSNGVANGLPSSFDAA